MSKKQSNSQPGRTIDYGRVKDIALRKLDPTELLSQLGEQYKERAARTLSSEWFSDILRDMSANDNVISEPIILIKDKSSPDQVYTVLCGLEYILAASGLDVPKIDVLIIEKEQSSMMQAELSRFAKRQELSDEEDLALQYSVQNYYDDI